MYILLTILLTSKIFSGCRIYDLAELWFKYDFVSLIAKLIDTKWTIDLPPVTHVWWSLNLGLLYHLWQVFFPCCFICNKSFIFTF